MGGPRLFLAVLYVYHTYILNNLYMCKVSYNYLIFFVTFEKKIIEMVYEPVTFFTFSIIFGTLKHGSLEINSLVLNNCFSYSNVYQNVVNTLSKKVSKTWFSFFLSFFFFFQKLKISFSLDRASLCKFYQHVVQIFVIK